ncbi:MAG: outer membrane lipoprotein LolB [Gammaproteobacteria bacterium]|nr:outer membrane lipoprotein LolB [Gammaproteobacteria bacterium]
MRLRLLCLAGAGLLLSACATAPRWQASPEALLRWEARAPRLEQLQHWSLDGRFGFKRNKDAFAASLSWTQGPEGYALELVGPLGQDIAHLQGQPGAHRIDLPGRPSQSGPDVEELLDDAIGYPLPLNKLGYWVRGLPAPGGADVRELDAQGRLARIEDDGWEVSFLRYQRIGDRELPTRINLANRWFTLKFAILGWDLPAGG